MHKSLPIFFYFFHSEHHKHILDFGDSSKRKDENNNYTVGSAPKTPRRSPRQFLSSIAHDATTQMKADDHDTSSSQISGSELLSFAGGGTTFTEGRGSGRKQKIGDVNVPDLLFKDPKDSKKNDTEVEHRQILHEHLRSAFDEKSRKMKTYLSRNLNPKQLLAMKANLVKIRCGLMSPSDKTSDSFFICIGKCLEELQNLEPAEICARMRTSLAHWIALKCNKFTQVYIHFLIPKFSFFK